jgi:Carboxypeptidase regulatory-like domain
MRILPRAIGSAAALMLLAAASLLADASTATLAGVVKDESGAALPGATITALNEKQGTVFTAASDRRGEYRIPLLRPDVYTVSCELSGFKKEAFTGVKLAVGSTSRIDFNLKLGGVTETVGVTAEAPLVDTTSSEVGMNVTPTQIQTLPVLNRSYLDLALLAPGVSFARDGNSPLAFGAQEGRAINVQVDGVDNNDESVGGQQTDINQDTVQEFQILSSQFTAEYGKASGGVINVVTKSGTNAFHGSAYYYVRDSSLDAQYFWSTEQPKLDVDNFGGTFGGPILKNSTFFFVSGDYNNKEQATTVDTGGVRPDLDGTFSLPDKQTLVSVKLDHQINESNHLSVGYHLDNRRQENLYVAGIYAESYGYSRKRNAWGANGSWNAVFSNKAYNELRAGYLYNDTQYVQNSSYVSQHHPSYYIGQNYFMPQGGTDKKFQILDSFTSYLDWLGEHQLKVGASYANWKENFSFPLTSGGSIYYNSDDQSDPYLYLKGYGDPTANERVQFYAVFVQDQWKYKRLTLNLGLRFDYEPGSSGANFQSAYPFIETPPQVKTQWSPRFGFAWDPGGDGKSVVRGGAGMFYYQLYNNLALDQAVFNGTTYKIAGFDCSAETGNPALCDPSNLPDPTQGEPSPPLIRTLNPNIQIPYTIQYSLGYQQQLGQSWSVGVDLLYIRGLHELYERDLNVTPNPYWPIIYPEVGRIREINSDASSHYQALELLVARRFAQNFQMQLAYTFSKATNETSGFYIPIPDSSQPISYQKGPADADQRHRLVLSATYNLPWDFQIGGIFRIGSGQPWNAVITGGDTNGDGARGDRLPGDTRNNQNANTYSTLDMRLGKTFTFSGVSLTLIASVFNIYNRRNYDPAEPNFAGGYSNRRCSSPDLTPEGQCVEPDPDFGTPGPPGFPDPYAQRQLQFAARISF